MLTMIKRSLPIAAMLIGLPLAAAAQSAGPSVDALDQSGEVGAWLSEMQQVHQQLEGFQEHALRDPELTAAQEELGEEIRVAMGEVDPTLGDQLERISQLEEQATQAQQSGDAQALQTLMSEARQIQERFMSVQEQVLSQPPIATKVTDFQTRLESKMIEMHPEAEDLITRFRELETKLNAAIGPGA